MTRNELKQFFKDHLVPASLYNLKGGNHNNRICMEQVKGGWNVYFSEKKDKIGLMHFDSEEDACTHMLAEIGKVMEGVYGLRFAR